METDWSTILHGIWTMPSPCCAVFVTLFVSGCFVTIKKSRAKGDADNFWVIYGPLFLCCIVVITIMMITAL